MPVPILTIGTVTDRFGRLHRSGPVKVSLSQRVAARDGSTITSPAGRMTTSLSPASAGDTATLASAGNSP